MRKIVFICAAMMAFAATAFAQECDYDPQVGVIKIWKSTAPLSGNFSVSSTKKVCFAPGNLQYNSNTQKWQFAEHQYDYIGNRGGNTHVDNITGIANNNDTVDLFGWVGASSNWDGLKQYGITSSETLNSTSTYGNVATENLKSDWGTLMGSTWRTLTESEWIYLFNTRTGAKASTVNLRSDARFANATINTDGTSVKGVILFPDGGTFAASEFTEVAVPNSVSAEFTSTTCTSAQWEALEAKGCVFFPAAGRREGAEVSDAGSIGFYRSSSPSTSDVNRASYCYLNKPLTVPAYRDRCSGFSVRLVKDVVTP